MKKILIPILLLCGLFAKANTIISHVSWKAENGVYNQDFVRDDNGIYKYVTNLTVSAPTLSVLTMGSLTAGDDIIMNPGNYTTFVIGSAVHDVTIINSSSGQAVFTGSNYADLGNSGSGFTNLTIRGDGATGIQYGIKFTNSSDAFLLTGTYNNGLRMLWIDFEGVPNNIIDVSGYGGAYNGTAATFKLRNVTLSHLLLNMSGELWQGFYGTPSQNTNLCDSVQMDSIIVTQTATNQTLVAGPITHLNAFSITDTYTGLNPVTGDVGVFQTAGDGQIHHCYFKGGRGYLCRQLGYSTGSSLGDFWFYDNIILAQNAYGGTDERVDSSNFGGSNPYLTGCNLHIFNNTMGNKTDINGYVCPVAIIGVLNKGATAYVEYNFAFNNQYGANKIVNYNNNGTGTIDTLGNYYQPASGVLGALADTSAYCALTSGSYLRNAAVFNSNVATDFFFVSRSNPTDVGARVYSSATLPPTLIAMGGATVDNPIKIIFSPDNATWRGDITSITINGSTLPGGAWSQKADTITLIPSASSLLQTPSSGLTVAIIATTFSNATVTQPLAAGAATHLSITTQPGAPPKNPGTLSAQPIGKILDQYNNLTSSTANVTATASGWTIGGTVTVAAVGGVFTFTNLTAGTALTTNYNAVIVFTSSGLSSATSNAFQIIALNPPGCGCFAYARGGERKFKIG